MRVVVDTVKCIGSGMCTTLAPSVFELAETGELAVKVADLPAEMVASVLEAVACCPVGALALERE